ncbi:MAG: Fic family protein [Planctomycetota bacterium]
MTYIYELSDWPELKWDLQTLSEALIHVRFKQGRHLGKIEALGFDLKNDAALTSLTDEVVKSSAIEGERLVTGEVRSSIARKLGIDVAGLPKPGREVEAVVQMMLDATRNHDQPLSKERLCNWHAALFPTGRSGMFEITVGDWRTNKRGPMQIVSGRLGHEKVHYQAPEAERLVAEMDKFIDWFNTESKLDPVLKAGIAHFWFVTVHPFEDGNGRIARAIAEMQLSRADDSKDRFYSMSSGIESQREQYYWQLESSQTGSLDITAWLVWFLNCLESSIVGADDMLKTVLFKAKVWQRINPSPINERQRKIIKKLLDGFEGNMTTSKYSRIAKCSTDTALRDIIGLVELKILEKNEGGGRSTSYRLAEFDDK